MTLLIADQLRLILDFGLDLNTSGEGITRINFKSERKSRKTNFESKGGKLIRQINKLKREKKEKAKPALAIRIGLEVFNFPDFCVAILAG